jgi:hypothetical protein
MQTFLKTFLATWFAALLALGAAQPAGAQAQPPAAAPAPPPAGAPVDPANTEQLFISFLGSQPYLNFIDAALASTEPAVLKAECARMTMREHPRYAVVRPPAFTVANNQGAIVDGVWIAWVPVDRCGVATVRRILIVVAGPNNLTPSRMLPGEFGGDLRLEADVQRTVVPLFMELAQCTDDKAVFVSDIKMLQATQQKWTEHWFGNACGKQVAMLVHYTRAGNAINFETELPPDAARATPALPAQPVPVLPQLRPGLPAAPPPGLPTRPGGVAK